MIESVIKAKQKKRIKVSLQKMKKSNRLILKNRKQEFIDKADDLEVNNKLCQMIGYW